MNRRDRVRREIPGAPEALITELASRPAAEVAATVAALRQAKREALAAERERRRQRRIDARNHGWYDEGVLAARDKRLLTAAGRRARGNLEALQTLAELGRRLDEVIHLAVDGLRANGYSDPEIGSALGITRQSVGEWFGRRGDDDIAAVLDADDALDDVMAEVRDGRRCGSCGRVRGMPSAPCAECPDDVRVS